MPALGESKMTSFIVASKAGRVEWSEATEVLDASESWFECGWMSDAAPRLERFLERHGQSSKRSGIFYVNRSLSCRERRLAVGDLVEVVGRLGAIALGGPLDLAPGPTAYRDAPTIVRDPPTIRLEPLYGLRRLGDRLS